MRRYRSCRQRAGTGTCRTRRAGCARREVYDYLFERLRAYYLDGAGGLAVTTEMFDAVLGTRPRSPLDFDARLRALAEFLVLPDATSLAAANKRIANILRKTAEPVPDRIDTELLRDPAELRLGEQLLAIARVVEPKLAARDYTQALQLLAALRPGVDGFFDSVLVMADEPQVRGNRLALLARHSRTVHARSRPVATARLAAA